MSTSTDPTTSTKPRLPKAYTEEQLVFLRSHLAEFERRSSGAIRGDAKKFALDRAVDFINKFGLPTDFEVTPGIDAESRFREQIYNWFKNTIGRTRRKIEGRPRPAPKKKEAPSTGTLNWTPNLSTPNVVPYSQTQNNEKPRASQSLTPIPYSGPQPSNGNLSLNLNVTTLRDAFITPEIDASTLSSMIQTYVMSNPSPTPLITAVAALFDSISLAEAQSPSHFGGSSHPYGLVRKFHDACSYFPSTVVHAGVSGPRSGARALQMQIRKCSIWIPNPLPPPTSLSASQTSLSSSPSMTDSVQRIASDRQRRKDFIQWSRVHAAAIELGMLDRSLRSFSEMMAVDAVWEEDEVEWVAGICVLRALIRTVAREDKRQIAEYVALIKKYEGRWKEIRDEGRQELVTEVLLDAKDTLVRIDENAMK